MFVLLLSQWTFFRNKSRTPFASAFLMFVLVACFTAPVRLLAQEPNLKVWLAEPGMRLENPERRAEIVQRLSQKQRDHRREAVQLLRRMGLPERVQHPDGRIEEIARFEAGQPLYFTTHNANAAISTGANLLNTAPYGLNGTGVTLGLWDGGAARSNHSEFGGRITIVDASVAADHATHVAGTMVATGLYSPARGMANAASILSHDWTNDLAEMAAKAATYPGEPGKIYISNHSYGYVSGWNPVSGGSPARSWEWYGSGTNAAAVDPDFGQYSAESQQSDLLAAAAPYYLIFRSAGNDRNNNPTNGQSIALSPGSSSVVVYNSASHPAGDGNYRGGYETIGYDALGKNVLTVGAVNDAVSAGTRSIAAATMVSFSSWGPTDDGRIKPDLVANGQDVISPVSVLAANGADQYGSASGTSMATPNASGSASLLVQQFSNLFPGQAMRSSTLKALLIHTADDLGTAGPDYINGWGLLNAKAAADIIRSYQATPGKQQMTENRLQTGTLTRSHSFVWDGVSPIRATLCWTDVAGNVPGTSDNRTANLVNNLNLKIIAPGGAEYFPFVMPFVGTWTQASMAMAATTGVNNTDNVEQVKIASPGVAGTYQAVVSLSGALTGGAQDYALILSGATNAALSSPTLATCTPNESTQSSVVLNLGGTGFRLGCKVSLTRTGESPYELGGVEVAGESITTRGSLLGLTPGFWNVVVTNPDGQSATLNNGLNILQELWSQKFDASISGWSSNTTSGSTGWATTTSSSHTPTTAYFAAGISTKRIDNLVSETIAVPSNASNMSLRFWHKYNLESQRDCGILELSIDNGTTWFNVNDSNSGASFVSGGYNAQVVTQTPSNAQNAFAGQMAWTGNTGTLFSEVVVALNDTAKFAGKNMRLRWRLSTNSTIAILGGGWTIDSVSLNKALPLNSPPVISVAAASSNLAPVAGASTTLSVGATDDGGAGNLTYTWSHTGPALSYSQNASNAASSTQVTFSAIGTYTFTCTVQDAGGLTNTSQVLVLVNQGVATVQLGSLSHIYDSGPKAASVTTIPPGLAFTITYNNALPQPVTVGSYNVVATVTDANYTGSASATLVIQGVPYTNWETEQFTPGQISDGQSDANADPDFDGIPNLIEFALGANPLVAAPAPTSVAVLPDGLGDRRLTLTFTRPRGLGGLVYAVQANSNIANALGWTNLPSLEISYNALTDTETVIARDTVIQGPAQPTRALRLKISQPAP